ncbi:2Fe-2S iron-sulfur cluster-binding protein [Luteimonas saliphila]|uniref:2Fe-2S iron-sulfur cluster-binding protein n=1 Tax=Luteimonas saliphila TaxID=2804919 RepID=UPI001EE1BBD3|nr:2Fe-2S iron-sulfur cluster-binding protein [Luteimonas saliphila]
MSGTSVAAAIAQAGAPGRLSCSGQRRAPVCGMGVCFECRANVDGCPQQRTCQLPAAEGMVVLTDD